MVMLSDATDQWKPMPAAIYLYVNDSDATYKHAFQAGCTSVMESAVKDRNSSVITYGSNPYFYYVVYRLPDCRFFGLVISLLIVRSYRRNMIRS